MFAAVSLIILFLGLLSGPAVSAQNLPTVKSMEQLLVDEIAKFDVNKDGVLDHLRTSYVWGPDFRYARNSITSGVQAGVYVQQFDDVFHNPADTIYTLALAYPHLPPNMQAVVRTYMQSEFNTYRPYLYDHMGIAGSPREINDIPQNEYQLRPNNAANAPLTYAGYGVSSGPTTLSGFPGWTFNPFNYYALAKYAEVFSNATEILSLLSQNGHGQPPALPTDQDLLRKNPHIVNSYIAGYFGYQRLRELANLVPDQTNTNRLESALQTRVVIFPSETEAINLSSYEAGGFLWLVPELGDYLRQNAYAQVEASLKTWKRATAYYMIPNADEATRYRVDFYNEAAGAHLYDESSLYLAQALIEKKSRGELEDLLHGPGLFRGDLFYIQNLVYAIAAGSGGGATPAPTVFVMPGDANRDGNVDGVDYVIWLNNFGRNTSVGAEAGDFDSNGSVDGVDYVIWLNNYSVPIPIPTSVPVTPTQVPVTAVPTQMPTATVMPVPTLVPSPTSGSGQVATFVDGFNGNVFTAKDNLLNSAVNGPTPPATERNLGAHNNFELSQTQNSLLEFDLSSIPATATIIDATLHLFNSYGTGGGVPVSTIYSLTAANASWVAGLGDLDLAARGESCWEALAADGSGGVLIPWAGSVGAGTAGVDYEPNAIGQFSWNPADPVGTDYAISLDTRRVQGWLGANNTNYGIIIRTVGGGGHVGQSDHYTTSLRPKLVVRYSN